MAAAVAATANAHAAASLHALLSCCPAARCPAGFRRYDRIRETLLHELAHMVWGEHDTNFKQLKSRVWRGAGEG